MSRASTKPRFQNVGELLEQLGGIDPRRVPLQPAPGKATERDLIRLNERKEGLYELVDGVLVEKVMGVIESGLAAELIYQLKTYLAGNDLGMVLGADGATRLMPGLVRVPDVSFVSWDRVPVRGQMPDEPILGLAPDLGIEVLSKSNTRGEMNRKLREYFLAGVSLVWYVDPVARTVQVFTDPEQPVLVSEDQSLEGGEVLPGFRLSLKQLFIQLPPKVEKSARSKGKSSKKRPGPTDKA